MTGQVTEEFVRFDSSELHEELKEKIVATMVQFIAEHPTFTGQDLIVTVSRVAGYCAAAGGIQDVERCRRLIIANMDMAIKAIVGEQT